LLNYLGDQDLRHQVERQLNKTETYNSLANVLFWGQRGEMRLPALQDQLNRASCLRLVVALVILVNAAYLQAAVLTPYPLCFLERTQLELPLDIFSVPLLALGVKWQIRMS
jgi:TnpA family transposase